MHITQLITKQLGQAVADLQLPVPAELHLEHPADTDHGDYASNIAMTLFAQLSKEKSDYKNPRELANTIVAHLQRFLEKADSNAEFAEAVSEVSVAGPGFVNFRLSNKYLKSQLQQTLSGDYLQEVMVLQPKKIYVEHTQPNTNKPNHIGHLRNSILGMAIVRLLRTIGHDVVSTNINNDRGIANIKGMWAYLQYGRNVTQEILDAPSQITVENDGWKQLIDLWKQNKIQWKKPGDFNLKPDVWIGKFYVMGDKSYTEAEQIAKDMQHMVQAWEDGDESVRELWKLLNNWFYDGSWETLRKLKVELDTQEYESDLYAKGKEIILSAVKAGNEYLKRLEDGAIQAQLESFSLPNKILIRKDGTAIYMTFDVELTRKRTQDYKMDLGVWVVGSDQQLHFKQLFQLSELLGIGKKDKWFHLSYGMVELPQGKMSSRKGTVVTADSVLEMAVDKATQITDAQLQDASIAERTELAQKIGIGAVVYGILSFSPESKIKFDLEKAVNLTGNSGPYLQYTYVRCRSLLQKAIKTANNRSITNYIDTLLINKEYLDHQLNSEEIDIVRNLYQYSEIVELAAREYAPHHLCTYLYGLAQSFNTFYGMHAILPDSAESKQVAEFRLLLTHAVSLVLDSGLGILGIDTVEKM